MKQPSGAIGVAGRSMNLIIVGKQDYKCRKRKFFIFLNGTIFIHISGYWISLLPAQNTRSHHVDNLELRGFRKPKNDFFFTNDQNMFIWNFWIFCSSIYIFQDTSKF